MGSTKHKSSNSFSTTLCNSILYQKAAAQRTSGDRTQKAQGFWLEDRSWLEAKWSAVYGYGNHKHRGALSSIVPSGMMCVDYRCTKDAACAQTVAVVRMDIYHLARYLLMLKGRQLQPTVTIIHVRAILRLGLGSICTPYRVLIFQPNMSSLLVSDVLDVRICSIPSSFTLKCCDVDQIQKTSRVCAITSRRAILQANTFGKWNRIQRTAMKKADRSGPGKVNASMGTLTANLWAD